MEKRDRAYLIDMLIAAEDALRFVKGETAGAFLQNDLLQSAIARQLSVIGEAARCISDGFKAGNPTIQWRQISALRNILIHAYNKINYKKIWEFLVIDVPKLIQDLRAIPGLNPDEAIDPV